MKRYIKPEIKTEDICLTMPLAGSDPVLSKGSNQPDVEARSAANRGFWDGVWNEE